MRMIRISTSGELGIFYIDRFITIFFGYIGVEIYFTLICERFLDQTFFGMKIIPDLFGIEPLFSLFKMRLAIRSSQRISGTSAPKFFFVHIDLNIVGR